MARRDLAIRIFDIGDVDGRRAFTRAARRWRSASLGIELGGDCILIGPLTLVGRPGCGYCGAERMRAASSALGGRGGRRRRSDQYYEVAGVILAREMLSLGRTSLQRSGLVDHVVAVDLKTAVRSVHRVIPLPRCPACGGGSASARSHTTATSLSAKSTPWRVVDALAGWVDRRTGLISAVVFESPVATGLPFVATTAPPTVRADDGSLRALPVGWGKGLTVSGALLSAVGEAVERYAASLPDPTRIVWKRAEELRGEYLDPLTLPLYTHTQYETRGFPIERYDPRTRHPWVQGTWLGTAVPVWVPAILVYLSLTIRPTHLVCQGSSNGLAAATSLDEACLRATLELVERDALLAAWMTARAGRRVELDATCDRRLRAIVAGIESLGAAVEVYLLPDSAYGATVLCLGLGDGRRYPGVTLGLGTGADAKAALQGAVLELGQTGPYLRRMMRSRTIAVPRNRASVVTMLDHAAYYFPGRRATAFDRLRASAAPVKLGDLPRCRPRRPLDHCAAALAASGIRVAVVDVTSADLATGPFRVARAVSPDLQPITYGFGLDRQPVERLRQMGVAMPFPPIQPVW